MARPPSEIHPIIRSVGINIEHLCSPVIGPLIRKYIRAKQWYQYGRHHDAELNPYRILWISPDEIYARNDKVISKSERSFTHIVDGDWDQNRDPFESHWVYQSFKQRFVNDAPWVDTELYQRILERVNRGEEAYGCTSEADVEKRCRYLDELFETIQTEGFRPNRETLREYPRRIDAYKPQEIKVNIGRDGRFFYCNGKHRLSISKILGIDKIPVNVSVRHVEWQKKRNLVIRSLESNELYSDGSRLSLKQTKFDHELEHPDVKYLISGYN